MNYITQLQGVRRDAHHLAGQMQDEVNDLVAYLMSDKFSNDPTVQVKDILARLQPVRSDLLDLAFVTHPDNRRDRVHNLQE